MNNAVLTHAYHWAMETFLKYLATKGLRTLMQVSPLFFFLVWKFERQLVNITLPYMLHPCWLSVMSLDVLVYFSGLIKIFSGPMQ